MLAVAASVAGGYGISTLEGKSGEPAPAVPNVCNAADCKPTEVIVERVVEVAKGLENQELSVKMPQVDKVLKDNKTSKWMTLVYDSNGTNSWRVKCFIKSDNTQEGDIDYWLNDDINVFKDCIDLNKPGG